MARVAKRCRQRPAAVDVDTMNLRNWLARCQDLGDQSPAIPHFDGSVRLEHAFSFDTRLLIRGARDVFDPFDVSVRTDHVDAVNRHALPPVAAGK
jgi:hypothetical protein